MEQRRRSFAEKYNLNLPCKDLKDVVNLNNILKVKGCLEELQSILLNYILSNGKIGLITPKIMRFFFTKDVALKLTAQKEVPNKMVLKNLPVTEIILYTMKHFTGVVTESELFKSLGEALRNVKDWNGGRETRRRQTKRK